MLFGWMFVIVYILMSLVSALMIYGACVVAKCSPHELGMQGRDTLSTLDDWRKEQIRSFHVAVHPNLLLPRKGSH